MTTLRACPSCHSLNTDYNREMTVYAICRDCGSTWQGEFDAARIALFVRALIITLLEGGLRFEEGLIAARVLAFMLEEIKRDGNIDEDFLSQMADRLVREEMQRI